MSYQTERDETRAFAKRISNLGFAVYIAENGNYGFVTDETESRVLDFAFSGIEATLGGNYGPPSTRSGTGWGIENSPYSLKTADDVKAALYSTAPSYCERGEHGWRYYSNVKQYLAHYGSSSRFTRFTEEG